MDSLISIIATTLIFGLLKWLVPHKKRINIDELKLAQNAKKYSRYELFALLPFSAYMILVPCCFFWLGKIFLSDINNDESAVVFYAADAMIWPAIGLFFGFGTLMLPMNKLYEFLLKDEYDLYMEYTNRKHGFDGLRAWQPFS